MKPSHGHNNTIINGIPRIGWMTGGKSALWTDEDTGDTVERICEVDPLTGHILGSYNTYTIYPAYGYVTKKEQMLKACDPLRHDHRKMSGNFTVRQFPHGFFSQKNTAANGFKLFGDGL